MAGPRGLPLIRAEQLRHRDSRSLLLAEHPSALECNAHLNAILLPPVRSTAIDRGRLSLNLQRVILYATSRVGGPRPVRGVQVRGDCTLDARLSP
jgi:hypothetical protein